MNPKYTITAFVFLCFFSFSFQLNAQSCCEDKEDDLETKLCYLSAKNYCNSISLFCSGYSLDGNYMEYSLLEKLESEKNFGPNGIAPCNLVLEKLDSVPSVQSIVDCGCDIIFIPVVAVNPVTNSTAIDKTFIPQKELNAIKEWSITCRENVVIVFQAESREWGYKLGDNNINPNIASPAPSINTIFTGPFGSLTEFNQGGSYQAIYTNVPDTGLEVLATDSNKKSTIGIDKATNDIVVADIGIFCSGAAGAVSGGAEINNENDILVCNVFALACQLAADVRIVDQVIELCPLEEATLPNGQVVSTPGIYPPDTLVDFSGCDSMILTTEIVSKTMLTTNLSYSGCEGDDYNIISNGNLYNELNPFGQELIVTTGGCDSLIDIALQFNTLASSMITINPCPLEEPYRLSNGRIIDTDGFYIDTFPGGSASGCDSFLYLDFSLQKLSSDLKINPLAQMTNCNVSPFDNTIPSEYLISWNETNNLNCTDCPNPLISKGCEESYQLRLIDEKECIWDFDISVNYDYQIYIPNAFSPNGDGINDYYSLGLPPNCTDDGVFEIKIFDRWGGERFSSTDLFFQWNGREEQQDLAPGVYAYWIRYNCKLYEGDLTLIQ